MWLGQAGVSPTGGGDKGLARGSPKSPKQGLSTQPSLLALSMDLIWSLLTDSDSLGGAGLGLDKPAFEPRHRAGG